MAGTFFGTGGSGRIREVDGVGRGAMLVGGAKRSDCGIKGGDVAFVLIRSRDNKQIKINQKTRRSATIRHLKTSRTKLLRVITPYDYSNFAQCASKAILDDY